MKVRVVLTVDVDPDAWREEYGLHGFTNADVRADVRESCHSMVTSQLSALEMVVTDPNREPADYPADGDRA